MSEDIDAEVKLHCKLLEQTDIEKLKNYDFSDCTVMYCSGANMYRGYFCPDTLLELCVKGYKRGRLLKKVPLNAEDRFDYFIDTKGCLRCVHRYGKNIIYGYECIKYFENYSFGLFFTKDDSCDALAYTCRTQYDSSGQAVLYSNVAYDLIDGTVCHAERDKLYYKNNVPVKSEYVKKLYGPIGNGTMQIYNNCFDTDERGRLCFVYRQMGYAEDPNKSTTVFAGSGKCNYKPVIKPSRINLLQ